MKSFKRYRYVSASALIALCAVAAYLVLQQQPAIGEPRAMLTDPPLCVFGWSKDICEGKLGGDQIKEYSCFRIINGSLVECKTVEVNNATLKFTVSSSGGTCGNAAEVKCDETEKLDGTIYITGDFIFRKHDECPFRGCWRGEWKLVVDNVTIGSGEGHGTLGTGSHRAPTCIGPANQFCSPDCEKCADVQFIPSSDPPFQGTWFVGLEGCLDGFIDQGPFKSSEVCVVISGTLRTPGSAGEPFDFASWEFCGASDGTVLAKCEQ
jgi:hypothetical protein